MTTENQRLREALDHLKAAGIIQFWNDILPVIGADKNRLNYLTKDNGGPLKNKEVSILKKSYPQINWDWIASGEGEMETKEAPQSPDLATKYGMDRQELVRNVMARKSSLTKDEQIDLLIEEVLIKSDRIDKILAVENRTILQELKDLVSGK